jgi:putative ABC transport system ATP-binding protein
MLRTEALVVTFNRGTPLETRALRGVDVTVPKGQFLTVIGSNGAGKSTFLNALAGEARVESGRILAGDHDITAWPIRRRAALVARVFQDPRAGICDEMSLLENFAVAAARSNPRGFRPAIRRALREELRNRLRPLGLGIEDRLGERVDRLSGGQRQSLTLIMAAIGQPEVLLLDEHTAALDPASADLVMGLTRDLVRSLGITTIMVTHSMRQALAYGDRTILFHQGQIALDVAGPERAKLRVEDLLHLFERRDGADISGDLVLAS